MLRSRRGNDKSGFYIAGCSIVTVVWIISILLTIILSIILERKDIDNSPGNVSTVEAMSTKSNIFTYSAMYSANNTQSVTLELLTRNCTVWVSEGDCIRPKRELFTAKGKISLNSTVRRSEVAFHKDNTPLFALPNSSLNYTIRAVSTNKTGCIFFYFFKTRCAFENFLQSNGSISNIEGYYKKSINCTVTDGKQHNVSFSINVTGETFVGLVANVNTNITYNVSGLRVKYDTVNCQQHTLKYKEPLKINICKSKFCAFATNKTIIVIDSKEQGVYIHWDPKPLEFTLLVWKLWITIIVIAGLLVIVIFCLAVYCLMKFSWKRIKQKRNKGNEREPLIRTGAIKATKIRKDLLEVLESCYYEMSTIFTKDIKEIASIMCDNQVISSGLLNSNPSYDNIIVCFKGALNFMKTEEEIKDLGTKFLKSIDDMKKSADDDWRKLATAIMKGWNAKLKKDTTIVFKLH